ncbi:MAG: fibronectin type III domain-containing protein [Paludibacteraceae bacterium]|nr:fibronectin type III domain-containing protein [Paludibacteraceae bacterium]
MKRLFLSLTFACLGLFVSTQAQTPAGYAIFGDVPDGYTDLSSAVNVVGAGSYSDKVVIEDGKIKLTGNTSLSTTRVCSDESNNVRLQFTSVQTLTWTSDFAIHIKIKKGSTNSNANFHFALCRDGWNSKRLGYLIPQSEISDAEESEIVLQYGDRATTDWSSANDNQMYGTNMSFSANDIVRLQAATGDYFEISQIFIEAEYVAPVEPLTPQDPKRYYFVRGGDLPVIDGVECVDLRATTYSAWGTNSITAPTLNENGASFTLPNSWFAADIRPKAQCMADVRRADWYLRMKFRTDASSLANQNLRINLSNGANNFHLTNDYGDGEWHDITFSLDDAANTLRSFPVAANDIAFQLHANGSLNGSYFYIEYAYLTNDPDTDEKPAIVDEEAPANFSVTEKPAATTFSSTTLQLYAEDEDTPITYTIRYAVKNSGDTPTEVSVNGAQGSTVEKTISSLAPETTYTFSVVASDPNGNETSPVVLDITTAAFAAQRYYLCRGDNSDIPSSASVTSTYVDCNVEFGNSSRNPQATDYISATTGNSWIAITLKPKATVANEIDDNWYIVVRFRANLSNNVFGFNNFRLNLSNNAQNWYINNDDADKPFGRDYYDGQWIVIKKRIGDRRAETAVPASYLQAGQVAVQMHVNANLIAGEFLDIDYAYFTNDISGIDEGTQSHRRIVLKDSQDNSSVLAARNGETVDVDLIRSLSSASYNSFCVPFNMNAEQVEKAFGADVKIGKLDNARIKENDELYLGFAFVDALEAGVPYIIQPGSNVTSSLIHNVTISNSLVPTVIDDVITFHGVVNPTEISAQSAEDHTILLLGAENTLSWPNTTANIKGMRAYFQTTSAIAPVVRRARLGFEQTEVATGINDLSTDSKVTKVVRDGQLYILRDGEEYSILGQHIHHINQ